MEQIDLNMGFDEVYYKSNPYTCEKEHNWWWYILIKHQPICFKIEKYNGTNKDKIFNS